MTKPLRSKFFCCFLFGGVFTILFSSCYKFSVIEKRKYRSGYFLQGFSNLKNQANDSGFVDIARKNNNVLLFVQQKTNPDTLPKIAVKDSVLTINPIVGDTIDKSEKTKFCIFPFWHNKKFLYGQFIWEDSSYYFDGHFKNGKIKTKFISEKKYRKIANHAFKGNSDYANSTLANDYAWFAIACLLLAPLLITIPFFFIFAAKAYKYGKAIKKVHPNENKYYGKRKGTFGIAVGSIVYFLLGLFILLLTYFFFVLVSSKI